jgi:UDP-N-acetylmuramoylalanine-D-glutamate ligase
VVGLGQAGFAAARALAKVGGAGSVCVWDGAVDAVQLERAAALRQAGVQVQLGGDGIDAIGEAGTIVKSPGVPPEVPVVATALARGLTIVDELEIGWHLVPVPTIGVTGTNGKSTTSALCVELLRANGLEPTLAGNTEFGPPLSELALGESPGAVVAEVSSYQAELARDLAVDAAIFTNLSPDHLNRHRNMDAYAAAKRRLFVRGEWCVPLASLNRDDALGRALAEEVEVRGGRVLTYGHEDGADYRIASCSWGLREAEVTVEAPDGTVRLETSLPGPHNAANATAVLALSDGLGLPREAALAALAAGAPVFGRFEPVEVDLPFDVVIDYAYARQSVASVLHTARHLTAERGGRVLTVLAIVGRAGPWVGGEVAAVARELSDHLILSASSYRGEPRIVTLAAMAAGARAASGGELEIVIDRRRAIARALERARPGDLVMVLGRGPTTREATDWRGGFVDLDDREIVRGLA